MINYKAIFFGIVGGVLGAFVGGFLIGIYVGSQGGSMSAWYLEQHIWLVYVMNISGGIGCGLATYSLEKNNLFPNLLIASTAVIVLSLVANPSLIDALSRGTNFDYLFEKAFLPLAVGWATPFIFLFFMQAVLLLFR